MGENERAPTPRQTRAKWKEEEIRKFPQLKRLWKDVNEATTAYRKARANKNEASEKYDIAGTERASELARWDLENASADLRDERRNLHLLELAANAARVNWEAPARRKLVEFVGHLRGIQSGNRIPSNAQQRVATNRLNWGLFGGEVQVELNRGGTVRILREDSAHRIHIFTLAQNDGRIGLEHTTVEHEGLVRKPPEIEEFEAHLRKHFGIGYSGPPAWGKLGKRLSPVGRLLKLRKS
ncbi:MAG: hypothetical protein V1708_00260 [Candidatus Micrarchaeota archaeon]